MSSLLTNEEIQDIARTAKIGGFHINTLGKNTPSFVVELKTGKVEVLEGSTGLYFRDPHFYYMLGEDGDELLAALANYINDVLYPKEKIKLLLGDNNE